MPTSSKVAGTDDQKVVPAKKPTSPHNLFKNLTQLVDDLLIVLSTKEKYIIEHRFGLKSIKKETLERIGKHYKITRERVRQIQSNALKKLQRTAVNTNLKIINEYGRILVQKNGGLMRESKLIEEIMNAIQTGNTKDISNIQLSLSLEKEIEKNFNTINYYPYWHSKKYSHKDLEKMADKYLRFLKREKNTIKMDELLDYLVLDSDIPQQAYMSILQIDKRIKITKDNQIGLTEWRHINPRTIRDKIFYVLRKNNAPLHFNAISEKILGEIFDKKNVNVQAVHNELIRNKNFVLIGRGIYALEEWGYKKGTVSNVIEELLSDGLPHTQEEIIEKVLEQRKIKKITILLNLKNKNKFQRVGRYMYALQSQE